MAPRSLVLAAVASALLGCAGGFAMPDATSPDGASEGGLAQDGGGPDAALDGAPASDAGLEGSVDALPPSDAVDAAQEAGPTACQGARPAGPSVLYYNLRSAPFPGGAYPDVGVHLPRGFDGTRRPGMLVFFHGFDNCVRNVLGNVDSPCVPGGAARVALHLVEQLDAARVNALLVAVEVEVDMQTGAPGALATDGNFHALLHELLTEHLDAELGCPGLDVEGFERVVLSSHSGGYQAVAAVLTHGRVPQVREVDLLDSLYGYRPVYDAWVRDQVRRFDPARADALRFVDVYTAGGGTLANSRAMAMDASAWLSAAGLSASLLDDDTTATLTAAQYAHNVLFKRSALAHSSVPQYYVQRLAAASGFEPL